MKNAAIYYVPEAFSITGQKLMGRNAAGWGFLKAFSKYADIDQLAIFIEKKESADAFLQIQSEFGKDKPIQFITPSNREVLSKIGNIFYPSPDINKESWLRTHFGDTSWGITGITHTSSSEKVMDSIKAILTSSLNPWDSVICTSEAVKKHVLNIIEAEVARLKHRLKIQQIIIPELPVIPLGVHTEDFKFNPHNKKSSKKTLGIPDESIVIIYMGRLSFHAKAHPASMYKAIETAAKRSQKKVTLIECGWFANDFMEEAFNEASDFFLEQTTIIRLDGRDPNNRYLSWSSADIFCSFADNIQETFGLTPIEAMASGLPCVVSDWNGYKETVRDQVDGFRVPTLMPKGNTGKFLAARYALGVDNYDFYCGHTNELISIEIEAAAKAFQVLFEDKSLRKRMGRSGQFRAESKFNWPTIISKYQELWQHQNEIRLAANEQDWKTYSNPSANDPFLDFNHYSSNTLQSTSTISLIHKNIPDTLLELDKLKKLKVFNFGKINWVNDDQILLILEGAKLGKPINQISSEENYISEATLTQGISWLLKLGLIKLSADC